MGNHFRKQCFLAFRCPHCACVCCVVLQVLDFELQKQLVLYMKEVVPLPGAWRCSRVAQAKEGCCFTLSVFTLLVPRRC